MSASTAAGNSESLATERAACDFCELPLTRDVAADAAGHRYCCYGCRFAASLAAASGDEAQTRWTMTRLGLAVFFSMNVMVCTLLLWSEQAHAGEMSAAWYDLFRYASLLFSLPVVFLLGPPIVDDARRELMEGRASLSVLLVLGVVAALGYSGWSVLFGGHVYCEVACAILLGVTLGKWLEANGKLQTTAALRSLSKLLPETVRIVREQVEAVVAASELRAGDSFRVLPGERIVADGHIELGEALIDEQAVTGESIPVSKSINSPVYSGTLVIDAPLLITAVAPAGEGTMARLIAAVKRGAESKSRYERLAERISRWFLPAVMLIAAGAFALHGWRDEWEHGLLAAVAVLVIACPCSLGLATPMALWGAVSRGAEEGILVRSGDALTQFAAVRTIAFDKTGTLTTGKPRLATVELVGDIDRAELAAKVQALVADSSHPLATALREAADLDPARQLPAHIEQIRHLPGRGVTGVDAGDGQTIYLGNRRWLEAEGQDCSVVDCLGRSGSGPVPV
jgi:cation transport ATPase